MSSTEDFSDVKKSCLTDELYTRCTQTCVKKKPYFPRKLMNLRPLNLNGIKKEIEESCNEQEKFDDQTSEMDSAVSEQKEHNSVCGEIKKEYPLSDKSNFVESDKSNAKTEDKQHFVIKEIEVGGPDVNIISEEKENRFVQCRRTDESFDLDFSALETPVKTEKSSATNNTHKLGQFDEFVTPKVNIIKTYDDSLSEKPYLRTPLNSFKNIPASKLQTSSNKPIFVQKILPNLTSENELACKSEIKPDSILSIDDYCTMFRKMKVKNVEYIVLNLLGKGGSSEVFHCYNPEIKCHVAIKCVSLQNAASADSYINEIKLLHQLQDCEKIIKMYDYEILASQKLLVVLEKGGEDLSKILKHLASQRSHIPMYMLLFYWMEMLYAVKQIHSHGIIHSDLKPANFLKADGGLKLIDFGIASSVQTDMTSIIKSIPEGSCNYISPEALNNETTILENQNSSDVKSCAKYKLHYKSDVWSLGCILYQLVYRRTPFQHITHLWSKLAAIINPDYKIDYPKADWVSPKIINTIKRCLQYNVRLRPSVDELIVEYEEILHNI